MVDKLRFDGKWNNFHHLGVGKMYFKICRK